MDNIANTISNPVVKKVPKSNFKTVPAGLLGSRSEIRSVAGLRIMVSAYRVLRKQQELEFVILNMFKVKWV